MQRVMNNGRRSQGFCFRWFPESKTLCAQQLFRHTNYNSDRGM